MTPEEQAAKEAADKAAAEEAAAAQAAADEDDKPDEDEGGEGEDKIDYEAELKAERDRRAKAEKELADRAFREREAKRKDKDGKGEDDEQDEDKPLTARQLQAVLAGERERTQKVLDAQRITDIAKGMAGSTAEADLIVEIHKNRSFPSTMTLQEQLEEAYIIANRKKIVSQNAELKRALSGRTTVSKDAASTQRDGTVGAETKLEAHDAQAIKASGMVWDGTKRMYKKPLGNGKKHLYFDPKTKKRFVAA